MYPSGTILFVVVGIKMSKQGWSRRGRRGKQGRQARRSRQAWGQVGLARSARQAGQIEPGGCEEAKKLRERRSEDPKI